MMNLTYERKLVDMSLSFFLEFITPSYCNLQLCLINVVEFSSKVYILNTFEDTLLASRYPAPVRPSQVPCGCF